MLYEIQQIQTFLQKKFGKAEATPDGSYEIPIGVTKKKHLVKIIKGMIHIGDEIKKKN